MFPLVFEKKTDMPCSAERLFRWHEEPEAFQRLLPPGEPVTILHHDGHVRDGARAVLLVGPRPFRLRWELEHRDYIAGRRFCDVQVKGPFTSYRHEHRILPIDATHSVLHDHITFTMPFGRLGHALGRLIILRKFERLFTFRHRVTREALS
jgi:ligand-binding SRPBCC domain-containing protein